MREFCSISESKFVFVTGEKSYRGEKMTKSQRKLSCTKINDKVLNSHYTNQKDPIKTNTRGLIERRIDEQRIKFWSQFKDECSRIFFEITSGVVLLVVSKMDSTYLIIICFMSNLNDEKKLRILKMFINQKST